MNVTNMFSISASICLLPTVMMGHHGGLVPCVICLTTKLPGCPLSERKCKQQQGNNNPSVECITLGNLEEADICDSPFLVGFMPFRYILRFMR